MLVFKRDFFQMFIIYLSHCLNYCSAVGISVSCCQQEVTKEKNDSLVKIKALQPSSFHNICQ